MDKTFAAIQVAFAAFNAHKDAITRLDAVGKASEMCLRLLQLTQRQPQGVIGTSKTYDVFRYKTYYSRPVNNALIIADPDQFVKSWNAAIQVSSLAGAKSFQTWNETVYTAAVAFACTYDLCSPGSRKTPGTYLEIIMCSLLERLTGRVTAKYIPLDKPGYNVTTDIVLFSPNEAGPHLVIPTKITTRERISQPFVHQRILDVVYPGKYKSVFIGMSEMQRDGAKGVKEICVPNQIDMFNEYVSKIDGFYYLDIPDGYRNLRSVRTGNISTFITEDLDHLL